MLLWNLKSLLADKGVFHPLEWMRKRGISYPRASKMWHGKASEIKLSQLGMLCHELRCTPNDLLAWKEEADPLPPDHPMQQLIKHTVPIPVIDDLSNMNADELVRVRAFMQEIKKERREHPDHG